MSEETRTKRGLVEWLKWKSACLELKEMYLTIIQAMCDKPIVTTILNREKLK
jgi:hypothetical protein